MITVGYIVWLIQTMIGFVILMNFLIAIISECYEEIMVQREQVDYTFKVDLNLESFRILSPFGNLFSHNDFNYILVSFQPLTSSDGEAFQGIVKTLRIKIEENTEKL